MLNLFSYTFAILILLAGCSDETTPGGAGGAGGQGGAGGAGGGVLNPCTINGVVVNLPVNPERALDLLIVIDDSPSMRDEQ